MTSFYSFPEYPHLIDTAPLEAEYAQLGALIKSVSPRRISVLIKLVFHISSVARALVRAGRHNLQVELKQRMLLSSDWRVRVLRDLGGEKKLARWEKIMARRFGNAASPKTLKPHASPAQRRARAANLEKARRANRRRWDERRPTLAASPQVRLDRVKVDRKGEFRLAPMPRLKRRVKVKPLVRPAANIRSVRKIRYTKIDPIPVWPMEFIAAQAVAMHDVIPHEAQQSCGTPAQSARVTLQNLRHRNHVKAPPLCKAGVPRRARDDDRECGAVDGNYIEPIFDG